MLHVAHRATAASCVYCMWSQCHGAVLKIIECTRMCPMQPNVSFGRLRLLHVVAVSCGSSGVMW